MATALPGGRGLVPREPPPTARSLIAIRSSIPALFAGAVFPSLLGCSTIVERSGTGAADEMNDSTDNIIVDTATRIFQDLCEPTTVNDAEKGVWPKALWDALEESGLPLAWVPDN